MTMRYLGRRTLWEWVSDPDGEETPLHYHFCPYCNDHKPCRMDCSLEPDLELPDGTPVGSTCSCDSCGRYFYMASTGKVGVMMAYSTTPTDFGVLR